MLSGIAGSEVVKFVVSAVVKLSSIKKIPLLSEQRCCLSRNKTVDVDRFFNSLGYEFAVVEFIPASKSCVRYFERVVEGVGEISRCLREFLEEVCLCESVCKRETRVLRCVRVLRLPFSLREGTFEKS